MASTFSDNWHQVAELRLGLLPSVRVHKQLYRGREWYVLQDIGSEKYFRLRPVAYRFASELSPRRTVDQVWQGFVERHPEEAPGQEEVMQLLAQLHHANLLFFRSDADNDQIFQRYQKQTTRENLGKLMAFLYVRIPVWNPNDFLNAWRPVLTRFFGPFSFLLWLVVVLYAAWQIVVDWDALWSQGQGILSLANLPWLYVAIFVLKLFHEMSHAIVCKKYGGQVHTMGIMFIIFTPLPYIDASASWSMRNRWHRVAVGAAGMYVELFFAALAALVWLNTGSGPVNSMAFNLMVAGSVSSLLFNGNPLLRFDAYYMLADMTELPNLYQKANQQWLYYLDRWLLGTERAEMPAQSLGEGVWFTAYGALSLVYRLFIMVVITLMVSDLWLGLGLLMAIMMSFVWVILPLQKLLKYLLTSPKLMRNRTRAWLVTLTGFTLIVLALGVLPAPYGIKSPGVVLAGERTSVFSGYGGVLEDIHVRPGQAVAAGEVLFRLHNDELRRDLEIVGHQITETEWLIRQALDQADADPEPLRTQLSALRGRQTSLQQHAAGLTIRAPISGFWQGDNLQERLGATLSRNETLGRIIAGSGNEFVAVVNQGAAAELFERTLSRASIRLAGQAAQAVAVTDLALIPFQQQTLPSPALSIRGGGSLPTQDDGTGREVATQAFYELVARVTDGTGPVWRDGMTGFLRVALPARPIAWQVWRRLRQLVQRRYQL